MHPYRSADGLLSSSDPAAVAHWDAIGARHAASGADWTETLRAMGVKIAHPDDGWVKRDAEQPSFSPSYPLFDDGAKVGDLLAFGYPYGGDRDHWGGPFSYRIVRVTGVERRHGVLLGGPYGYYEYEDTGIRLPETPKRTLWQRLRGIPAAGEVIDHQCCHRDPEKPDGPYMGERCTRLGTVRVRPNGREQWACTKHSRKVQRGY